jgi:hypothetical protein
MATTYLSHTNTTPTSAYKYTFSAWVKRGELATRGQFFRVINPSATSAYTFVEFTADDYIGYNEFDGGSNSIGGQTNAVYRDPNAWYHIVFAVDTTQATGADRGKLYVNGVQVTSISSQTTGTQNQTVSATYSGKTKYVGGDGSAAGTTRKFGGSMAHVHFCDGYTYDASYFGSTDATTGIWKPKTAPSVTYGTNGFFLKFASSGSMGTDSSGNGNNFSVAAGTLTQTQDTPSNVFCTINALSKGSGITLSNGNTTIANGSATWYSAMATLAATKGKYYWENKVSSLGTVNCGITKTTQDGTTHSSVDAGRIMYSSNGIVYTEGFGNVPDYTTGTTFTTNDIIGIALDFDNGTIKFYKNNTLIQTVTDSDISAYELTPAWGMNNGTFNVNFGNGYFGTTAVSSAESDGNGLGLFEYAPPSGYYALCTKNINSQEYS